MEWIFFTKPVSDRPVAEQARVVKEAGFDGGDFACRGQTTVNPSNAKTDLPEAARIFREEGLTIPVIASDIVNADSPYAEELFAACAEAGVKGVRLRGWSFSLEEPFDTLLDHARRDVESLEPLAEKHGVQAQIQIHSGFLLSCNASAAMRIVEDCDPKCVGIQWDAGHIAADGEVYNMSLAILGEFLGIAILKSLTYAPIVDGISGENTFAPRWVPLKDGIVPVKRVLIHLKEAGYNGPVSIHGEHTDADNEQRVALATKDLEYVRQLAAELEA